MLAPSLGWTRSLDRQKAQIEAEASAAPDNNPGAASLLPGFEATGDPDAPVIPALGDRASDWASDSMTGWCDEDPGIDLGGLGHLDCARLVPNEDPSLRVVAVGNSHTDQWTAALVPIAREEGWDLTIVRRPACFYTSVADNYSEACKTWMAQADAFLEDWAPDALVIQSTFTSHDGTRETVRGGTEDQVARWTGRGALVLGIRDNPRFRESHEECELRTGQASCSFEHVAASTPDPTASWESAHPGYVAIDMNDVVCPDGSCPSIIGGVYTYVDDNHVTATYLRTAAPQLEERLDAGIARARTAQEAASSAKPAG
ncbi:SGNH hydrolase domain-containing protein [Brachybacterium hainanense]|uniref:SGNH hydrolase domain-containing protein n=1 Tax=Brachybacterium hainanense TaxID=1541174 RepID=A0ABV6RF60_9MICO